MNAAALKRGGRARKRRRSRSSVESRVRQPGPCGVLQGGTAGPPGCAVHAASQLDEMHVARQLASAPDRGRGSSFELARARRASPRFFPSLSLPPLLSTTLLYTQRNHVVLQLRSTQVSSPSAALPLSVSLSPALPLCARPPRRHARVATRPSLARPGLAGSGWQGLQQIVAKGSGRRWSTSRDAAAGRRGAHPPLCNALNLLLPTHCTGDEGGKGCRWSVWPDSSGGLLSTCFPIVRTVELMVPLPSPPPPPRPPRLDSTSREPTTCSVLFSPIRSTALPYSYHVRQQPDTWRLPGKSPLPASCGVCPGCSETNPFCVRATLAAPPLVPPSATTCATTCPSLSAS